MSILKRFWAMYGIDAGGHTIINVADPVDSQDVATKAFTQNSIATAMAGLPGQDAGLTVGGGGAHHFNVAPTYAVVHNGGTSTGGGTVLGGMGSGDTPTAIINGGLSNG